MSTGSGKLLQPSESYIRKAEKDIHAAIKKWQDFEAKASYEKLNPAVEYAIEFARRNGLVVYGGHAIDAVLPSNDKIYTKNDVHDVDIFSPLPQFHAKKLAGELDDIFHLPFVEAKFSFMHDNAFNVVSMSNKIADFTYMEKDVIDSLFVRIGKQLRPMAPIDYILYSMHNEFSHPLVTPDRWDKTFGRFVRVLKHNPIDHDAACIPSCFIAAEKDEEKVIQACLRAVRKMEGRPPILGAYAVLLLLENINGDGDMKKTTTMRPLCPGISAIEVLSKDPFVDANHVLAILKKAVGTSTPEKPFVLNRSPSYWLSLSADNTSADNVTLSNNNSNSTNNEVQVQVQVQATPSRTKKAHDGQSLDEVVILYGGIRIISFINAETCSHVVSSGDIALGGIDTIMKFLYKRYLFGPSNKSPSSPISTTLRCLINTMYDVQFRLSDKKRTKITKRFSTSDCYGISKMYMDVYIKQKQKAATTHWIYRAYEPVHRESRLKERALNNDPPPSNKPAGAKKSKKKSIK